MSPRNTLPPPPLGQGKNAWNRKRLLGLSIELSLRSCGVPAQPLGSASRPSLSIGHSGDAVGGVHGCGGRSWERVTETARPASSVSDALDSVSSGPICDSLR